MFIHGVITHFNKYVFSVLLNGQFTIFFTCQPLNVFQISAQAGELLVVKSDLSGLQAPSSGGGTINTAQLVSTIKAQTQADIQKAQKDVKQVQNMVTTLLTQVAMLSSKVNKLCPPTTPSG